MKIISIDPGYERLGIAILEKIPKQKDILIYSECFKTSAKIPFNERLGIIGEEVRIVIEKYKPEAMAIETLFLTTNQKTAMQVAEARGVVVYEGARAGLKIFEFTPLQVKIAVSSYGKADKKQVHMMVKKLISIDENIKSDDEIDAIAVGLTCLASVNFQDIPNSYCQK